MFLQELQVVKHYTLYVVISHYSLQATWMSPNDMYLCICTHTDTLSTELTTSLFLDCSSQWFSSVSTEDQPTDLFCHQKLRTASAVAVEPVKMWHFFTVQIFCVWLTAVSLINWPHRFLCCIWGRRAQSAQHQGKDFFCLFLVHFSQHCTSFYLKNKTSSTQQSVWAQFLRLYALQTTRSSLESKTCLQYLPFA